MKEAQQKAKAETKKVGLTDKEEATLKRAKAQLASMNQAQKMGMEMDEDQREEIETTIRYLERRKDTK